MAIPFSPGEVVAADELNELARAHWRKTTSTQVVSTVTETDLLNGEITIDAGAMATSRMLRLTAAGDWLNNTGSNQITPRFKLKLGATTLIDTATIASNWTSNAGRMGWHLLAEIKNLGATNSQWTTLLMDMAGFFTGAGAATFTTGEGVNEILAGNLAKLVGGNSSAVDTTLAQALAFTVTLPVSNASCDVTLKTADIEVV